jgi:type IV pilus biogenesis protein PilP
VHFPIHLASRGHAVCLLCLMAFSASTLAQGQPPAQPQSPASADIVDLDAVMKKGLELHKAKLESQILNERYRSAGPGAAMQQAQANAGALPSGVAGSANPAGGVKEMTVVGIYGVGEHLIAHLVINGSRVPVRLGSDVDSWRVEAIDERSVTLRNRTGKAVVASATGVAGQAIRSGSAVRLWLHTDRMPENVLRDASSRQWANAPGSGGLPLPAPLPPGMLPARAGANR